MTKFTDIDETIEVDGFTLTARIDSDSDMGPPWQEHDGHGPVSDWTNRNKRAGELELSRRGSGGASGLSCRFYDFAEACRIARRDGWGDPSLRLENETARAFAARMARDDFERMKAWCDDRWQWVGVIVDASRAGVSLGRASLWGIESDADSYLVEVANELAEEAVNDAREKLKTLTA